MDETRPGPGRPDDDPALSPSNEERTRLGGAAGRQSSEDARGGAARPSAEGSSSAQHVGRYRLLARLGEGGMGVVFEAEQENPRRRVALKVVRGGAFVDELHVRMFQREAETLARLDHPNIGAIYEAGHTEEGQHFFAMELVRGPTLDAWLQSRPIAAGREELVARLRLFQVICEAVQYAHQRGVIHRDLKPSNIIVAKADDARPSLSGASTASGHKSAAARAVKILDFGLARIADADAAGPSVATEVGAIKGTLAYMSPEQARGNPAEIDTRADVYALGVLLYELLTRRRPIDISGKSLVEAIRAIVEDAPAPLHEGWDFEERLDPDLATIVAKALAKDAEERYASAAALAEDVERLLTSQPILARPPSTLYQLRKLVARRRAPFAAAAAGVVLLALFGVGMSVLYARAEANLRRAQAAEARAEENFGLARGAVDEYLTEVGESNELKAAGFERLRRELLGTARDFYEKLAERGGNEVALRADQGAAHIRLANISRDIGDLEEAIAAGREGVAIFEQLLADDPASPLYRRELATLWSNLGLAHLDRGEHEDSEAALERAIAIDRALVGEKIANASDRARLSSSLDTRAQMLERLGRVERAKESYEASIAIRRALAEESPGERYHRELLAHAYNNLGVLFARQGRAEEAEAYLERALPLATELGALPDARPAERHVSAVTWGNLAGVRVLLGRLDEAREDYAHELEQRRALARAHPAVLDYQRSLGFVLTNLGELETRAGAPEAALSWFSEGLEAFAYVLELEPRHAVTRYATSYAHTWRAKAHEALGRPDAALADIERAIAFDDRGEQELIDERARLAALAGRP